MNRSALVFLLSILLMRGNATKHRRYLLQMPSSKGNGDAETAGRPNSKTIDESLPETVPLIPCTVSVIPRQERGGHPAVRADV